MTLQGGLFKVLQDSIGGITNDRRLQLVLIAFCFGAFFEGAAGGGTPVAVTGAILIGLGFHPLAASGLSLIANTAPVAYGGLGNADHRPASVTQPDNPRLSAHPVRHGGTAAAVLFRDCPDLAGANVLRLAPHGGSLAGDAGRGLVFCNSAIPDFELPRPVAGGHARRDDLHGHPRRVPCVWKPKSGHARCFRQRDYRAPVRSHEATSRAQPRHGDQGVDAVGDSDRHPVPVGPARRQGIPELQGNHLLGVADSGPAQPGAAGGTRRLPTHASNPPCGSGASSRPPARQS